MKVCSLINKFFQFLKFLTYLAVCHCMGLYTNFTYLKDLQNKRMLYVIDIIIFLHVQTFLHFCRFKQLSLHTEFNFKNLHYSFIDI